MVYVIQMAEIENSREYIKVINDYDNFHRQLLEYYEEEQEKLRKMYQKCEEDLIVHFADKLYDIIHSD